MSAEVIQGGISSVALWLIASPVLRLGFSLSNLSSDMTKFVIQSIPKNSAASQTMPSWPLLVQATLRASGSPMKLIFGNGVLFTINWHGIIYIFLRFPA